MTMKAQLLPVGASRELQAATEAALRAGDFLRKTSAARGALRVEEKSAGDFVSEADRTAEAMIRESLERACPGHGWIGEESGARPGQTEYGPRWIVDPLDGTTNFLKGLPHWAVSIAFCKGEDVLCGVIHDPAKSETFVAEKGKGAWLNGAAIHVSQDVPLRAAILATGVPAGGRTTYLAHALRDMDLLMPRTAGVRRWGSAALDLAYVAAGRLDAYWERNLGPWDVAAGMLMVQEAGGHIARLWPGAAVLTSGSLLASNADLGPELLRLIDRTRKPAAAGAELQADAPPEGRI
jgi:myo-inositol-1(or 4)-monophosphatase